MGFLDHSTNNIVVDAVLTDLGRQALARNDGSFSIYQFALGDDEIDYSIIQQFGRTVGKEKIEKNTPIMEALTGIMSGFIAWHFGYGFITVAAFIFVWSMIALAFIDLDTQLLPDEVTLPLLWIGLLINLGNSFTDISSAVIGAASGYIFLWLIYWCFRIATGKEGMGYGDFKLLAVIGAWFGWKMLPLVILLSSLAAVVIGIVLIIVAKNKRDAPFPFGPYLVGSGFVALFWGDQLNRTYLDLL